MTTFIFTDPSGKEHEVTGPDGATKEQAFQVLQSKLQSGSAPTPTPAGGGATTGSWGEPAGPTLAQSASRQGKLLVRALASAVASPVTLAGDAANKFVNGASQLMGYDPQLRMPSQMFQSALTAAGLPKPETGIEKFTQGVGESAPAFALPAGLAHQAVGNAFLGAAQAPQGSEASGAGVGAAFGAGGQVLARTLSGLVKPTRQAQVLLDQGVGLTPGQAAGTGSWIKRFEDAVTSLPAASHVIKNAQARAIEESNVAAAQVVTNMVAKDVRLGKPPREAIEKARETIGEAYDFGLSGMSAPGKQVVDSLSPVVESLPEMFPMAPMRDLRQVKNFVEVRVRQMIENSEGGVLTGAMLKLLDSELGQQARNFQKSSLASDRTVAPAWLEIQSGVRQAMELGQPDANKLKTLQQANAAYRQLLALEGALLPGAETFTPRRLAAQLDKREIKTGALRDVSKAMTATLPNTVPNSGTPERLLMSALPSTLMGGGYAAQEFGFPTLGAGAMTAGALGSRAGARMLTGATRPQRFLSPYEAQMAATLAALRGGYSE